MAHANPLPAFVLHSRRYRESSTIVDLFVPETGRVSVVARGINRGKSQLAATLQPFYPLLVSYTGRSELKTLKTAELNGEPLRLSGKSLLSGLYLNELIARTVHTQDHCEALFAAYQVALERLAAGAPIEPILRRFEFDLLEELGYGIPFPEEAMADEGGHERRFYYYQQGYFEPLQPGMTEDPRCYSAQELSEILAGNYASPDVLKAAKRLARQAITPLLAGKELNSRALFRDYYQEKP